MNLKRLMFAVALAGVVITAANAAAAEAPASTGHAEAAAESGPNPLAFDPDLAIFSGIIFLLLVGILGKFAWPPIVAALDERERRIAANIAAAEALQADAKRLLAEHEAQLAAAAGEVRALLEDARRDADQTRRQIEADGHKAAKEELDRAVREIGRARDAAVQDLAVTSANVAIDLARGVMRTEISADRQQQIVREALTKLSAASPSKN